MNKILEKTGSVALKTLITLLILGSLISVSNTAMTIKDKRETTPNGKSMTIGKNHMNVYIKGNGDNKIVLMSGLGTAAPALDFEPLAVKLSKNNTVVVPEPLGYGWSDETTKTRSCENIVEEYREALTKAGIKPPYVLMPHSLSGIYAIYWAIRHPLEVAAVIGIDCTLPKQIQYFGSKAQQYPKIAGLACSLGVSRIMTLFSPNTFISENKENEYTKKNIDDQRKIASWNGYNGTVVNEANMVSENIKTTLNMKFSDKTPLLFFSAENDKKKPRADKKTSVSFYNTYITNKDIQKVVSLSGDHYLHRTQSAQIAQMTDNFLRENIANQENSEAKAI